MDREETIKLLMLVKGNWYRQPIDERITDVWLGILSAIPIQEAWTATMEIICSGAEELPTPGKIYHAVMQERLSRPQREHLVIEGPQRMTEDQRDALRGLIDGLAERFNIGRAQALPKPWGEKDGWPPLTLVKGDKS